MLSLPTAARGRVPGRVLPTPSRRPTLAWLAALGIVYGDIGTSPLYALRESVVAGAVDVADEAQLLGVASLVFWTLVVVVTVKYLGLVMRADDDGEGGIIALEALASRGSRRPARLLGVVSGLGMFGTALLYGDGMITPAISVLSAVEGIAVVSPGLGGAVVPLAIVILVGLFAVQRHGTARIGAVFGPVMLGWFAYLALSGLAQVLLVPGVLRALLPSYALGYLLSGGLAPLLTLGSVFLVATGSEALYADMGHFGRGPIARSWSVVVFPALVLQYLGQAALLARHPDAVDRVFYAMVPGPFVPLVVALATLATVIASQALISGAFSLTAQAVQLGHLPGLQVVHTSDHEFGQVYVPAVNLGLMLASIALVVGFGSSGALASAYGVAVVLTMVITTALFAVVARDHLGWSVARVTTVTGGLLAVDLAFLAGNVHKVPSGGWFPLVVGGATWWLMRTWSRGRSLLALAPRRPAPAVERLVEQVALDRVPRVPGTAVYLASSPNVAPGALMSSLASNHVLHEDVVLLTVEVARDAHVPAARRDEVRDLGDGFVAVQLRFGFADQPDVPGALAAIVDPAYAHVPEATVYVVSSDEVVAGPGRGVGRLQARLFAAMHRNAERPARHLGLPSERVVALGRPLLV